MKSLLLPVVLVALLLPAAAVAQPVAAPAPEPSPADPADPADPESDLGPVEPEFAQIGVDEAAEESGFSFGSYGRASARFDDEGNAAPATNVVSHGPRILEPSYAELDFRYVLVADDGLTTEVLATLALFEPFPHYTGAFGDQPLALRNLYAEMRDISPALEGLSFWAGSRMYRGDDIYLLDWWPLDNLNTLGGGAAYERAGFTGRLHVGVNRVADDFQLQTIEVPGSIFATDKVVLDRQRMIGSARLGYAHPDLVGPLGLKGVVYGEFHRLPGGERIPPELVDGDMPQYDPSLIGQQLPADDGFVLGAQLGLFQVGTATHVNLFGRWSRGVAAYGEFGVPFGTTAEMTADGAEELLAALSANWESRWVGVMAGAYLRRFIDADDQTRDLDDYTEGAVVVRPVGYVTEHFHQALELSYQQFYPYGLDPNTGQQPVPEVWQVSVLELLSMGRGNYARPQLRLSYTASFSNDDARARFPAGDARRPAAVEHIVSLGAEWWFNSSSY